MMLGEKALRTRSHAETKCKAEIVMSDEEQSQPAESEPGAGSAPAPRRVSEVSADAAIDNPDAFDVPATDPLEAMDADSAPDRLEHGTLQILQRAVDEKRLPEALLGYRKLADTIERSEGDHGAFGEAIWLEAARREFETGLQLDQYDTAIAGLDRRFRRLGGRQWEAIRDATSDYYQQMISVSVDCGLDELALDIFEQEREHVRLTTQLRRQLLKVSTRLNRADPATARLCIEEALTQKLDPKELNELFQVIRQAIRVDLASPDTSLLSEYVELNQQIREQTDLRWPLAHLMIAALRQNRMDDLPDLLNGVGSPSGTDADAACLIGATLYQQQEFSSAEAWFHAAEAQHDTHHGVLAGFLCELARLNRLLLTSGSEQPNRNSAQNALRTMLAGMTERTVPEQWKLDSAWLKVSANILLGKSETALADSQQLSSDDASWATAEIIFDAWRSDRSAEETATWADRLLTSQPVLHELLSIRQDVREFRFDTASSRLNEIGTRDTRSETTDLRAAEACLTLEVQQSTPDRPTSRAAAETAEFESSRDSAESGLVARNANLLPAWKQRLEIRQDIAAFAFAEAEQRLKATRWFTLPETEHQRLRTLLLFAQEPENPEVGERFQQLAGSPAALPVDQLHLALWQSRANPKQSLPKLNELLGRWPDCMELKLAAIRVRLTLDPSDATAANELESVCTLSTWRNHRVCAWMRPWQDLVPATAQTSDTQVSPLRLADMLLASDLQRQSGQFEASIRTLRHVEELAGADASALEQQLADRFRATAELALTRADWEQACEWHQEACRRGADHGDFAERLASRFATAETVPDRVVNILFGWVERFEDTEEQCLATETGRTIERLTRITEDSPESLTELNVRSSRCERLSELKPDWDFPRSSRASAAAREGNDALVVELVEALRHRQPDQECLLGHAFWNLQQFAKAERAFQRANDKSGWMGCARAADRLQQLTADGRWLDSDEADRILEALVADSPDSQQTLRVQEWKIAVLLCARRDEAVLAEFDRLADAEWLHAEQMQIAMGLSLLMNGRTDEACRQFCPPELLQEDFTLDRLAEHRCGLGLLMMTRLARPVGQEWHRLQQALVQLRKLNESAPAFRLSEALFALRLGDAAEAERQMVLFRSGAGNAAHASPGTGAEDLLVASLHPLLRAEADFVDARIAMHREDFAAAAAAFENNARDRLWPEQNTYWQAVSLASAGDEATAVGMLEEIGAANDFNASIPAQLAALHLRKGDMDTAESWIGQAARIDPEHPFVVLVKGQLAECRGEQDDAIGCFERLTSRDELVAGPRVKTTAHLALGRFAQAAGHVSEAVAHFREAHRCSPNNPVCMRRLGLILAVHAEEVDDLKYADQLLNASEKSTPGDAAVILGRVCIADALGNADDLARRLAQLVSLDDFERFPQTVRHNLALLSAETQLRCREYGAAADAFERLLQEQSDPRIDDRLRRCRLLQALQLVGQRPIPDGALLQIRKATEAVCAGGSAPPHVVLLQIIAELLLGEITGKEQRAAALERIDDLAIPDENLQEIAWTTRLWLGDTSVEEQLTERLSAPERVGLRRCVELIAASLNQTGDRFRDEAERLTAGDESMDGLPFDAGDIIVVGAIAGGKTDRERTKSCEFIQRWHGLGRGTRQTRQLLSRLLAQRGVKELKLRRYGSSRRLLQEAVDVVAGESDDLPAETTGQS